MASFQAKKGRDRLRMWEKKILVLIHSNPTRNRESQKNSKKIQKIKKHQYGFFSSQNGTREAENVRKKKILVLIHSKPTRNREFQKNSKKIKKIKKHQHGFFSSQKGAGEARNVRKKKSRSDPFQPDPE